MRRVTEVAGIDERNIFGPAPAGEDQWADCDLDDVVDSLTGGETYRVIPEAERDAYARSKTIHDFYADFCVADRVQKMADGMLSPGSLQKDRQSMNRLRRLTQPDNWSGRQWPGLPIGRINEPVLRAVMRRARADGLSVSTCRSWWASLHGIFREAVRRGAIVTAPKCRLPVDRKPPALFSPGQIDAIVRGLEFHTPLQIAFILAVSTGMRPVDLFGLRWRDFTLDTTPVFVTFGAKKTRKLQRIPLHPIVTQHLRRLQVWQSRHGESESLFHSLTSENHLAPERSRPARSRNAMIKHAINAVGVACPNKPWQACRATCNERMERHCLGSGQFLLGHSLTLNSSSYREPSDHIVNAVLTLPQPDSFTECLT